MPYLNNASPWTYKNDKMIFLYKSKVIGFF